MKTLRHNFAYDVSALADYTEQNVLPLVTKSLLAAKTADLLPIQTGIKSSEVINIMDTTVFFQDGATCGFTASGTTTFTQRTITVGKMKVNNSWCPDELEAKWTQFLLNAGSYYETLPAEAALSDFIAGIIAQEMELAYWRGDTTGGNPNLNKFDGFIKIIDAAGTAIAATPQADITVANVVGIFDDIYQKLPAAILDKTDIVIMCGWDTFRLLILGLKNQNLFNYDSIAQAARQNGELITPEGYRVVALHGLNGTDRIFAGRISNFYIGTDLAADWEQFRIWYSQDNDQMRMKARWKAGVQVAFPNEIVEYSNT